MTSRPAHQRRLVGSIEGLNLKEVILLLLSTGCEPVWINNAQIDIRLIGIKGSTREA